MTGDGLVGVGQKGATYEENCENNNKNFSFSFLLPGLNKHTLSNNAY